MQRAPPTLPAHPVTLRLLRPAFNPPRPPPPHRLQTRSSSPGRSSVTWLSAATPLSLSRCASLCAAVIQEGWGCGCSARQWKGPKRHLRVHQGASLRPAAQAPLQPQRCLKCRCGGHSRGAAKQRQPCALCLQASIEARKPDFDAFIDPQKKKADMIIQVGAGCLGAGALLSGRGSRSCLGVLHCLHWSWIAAALRSDAALLWPGSPCA